ncbi:MAG: T9SS type A sorting domain-containing protein [Bacteroidales bacterium]|nr:T9SS type A sorting domain-containing protein [Bacteroidales bacterium]
MKKTIIYLIFVLCSAAGFGQNNYSLVQEGKSWEVLSVILNGSFPWDTTYTTLSYQFIGDTTLNNKTYHKLYRSSEETSFDWNFRYFMREENKKVWLKEDAVSPDMLMYDLSASQGDTLEVGWSGEYVPLIVDSIGEIEINGTMRIKYWLSAEYQEYTETWIDGIGSNKGVCFSGSATMAGGWCWFLCMSEDGELIYRNPYYESCYLYTGTEDLKEISLQIYPNPAKTHLNIELPEEFKHQNTWLEIRDLNGRILLKNSTTAPNILLNISSIKPGTYLIKVQNSNTVTWKRIIIQ